MQAPHAADNTTMSTSPVCGQLSSKHQLRELPTLRKRNPPARGNWPVRARRIWPAGWAWAS